MSKCFKVKDLLAYDSEAEIVLKLNRDGRTTFFGCNALAKIHLTESEGESYLEFVFEDDTPEHVLNAARKRKTKKEKMRIFRKGD